ncbi:hypothetical protein BD324DRAFT_247646 [Kockovaella imperatae]|uniref:Ser-Thr-rich glycosyl-phosphatidyl-inositol-anchored membrane family-domain-containing protein n=1 Tax=Kockovaella imperatae TaxID=4999 RepID=A0A1Y1URB4_9TREE|nr:hypothetical protein BD324DRAFT_247646 [Kockovaella imperatae]ORX39986.1 hypothetical protein BD324DRAFT_247646 [Kockovaella imperatae]
MSASHIASLFLLPLVLGSKWHRRDFDSYAGAPVNNITVSADNVVQCSSATVSWTNTNPPVDLAIGIGGYYVGTSWLTTIHVDSDDSTSWTVNVASGDTLIFQVTDSDGAVAYVQNIEVQPSDDDSCLSDQSGPSSAYSSASASATDDGDDSQAASATPSSAESDSAASDSPAASATTTTHAQAQAQAQTQSPSTQSDARPSPTTVISGLGTVPTSTTSRKASAVVTMGSKAATSLSASASASQSGAAQAEQANKTGASLPRFDVPSIMGPLVSVLLVASSAFVWI